MSSIKETIKAEIERLYDGEAPKHDQQCEFEDGYFTGIATISKFIDSLPEEEPSKKSNPLFDKCVENCDPETMAEVNRNVDKMLLEEAAEECIGTLIPEEVHTTTPFAAEYVIKLLDRAFIAGAEWMRKKDVEDMYLSDNRHFLKCYEQGKVDMKVGMMKEAVEGTLGYGPHLQRPIIMLEQVPDIWNGSCQSVKVIILSSNDAD